MTVLNFIEKTEVKEIPIVFQCDICRSIFELDNEYDIKYNADVKKQMAVINYSYPTGSWGQYDTEDEIHCCSTECLAKAIKQVPFDAKITIPIRGFYKK